MDKELTTTMAMVVHTAITHKLQSNAHTQHGLPCDGPTVTLCRK